MKDRSEVKRGEAVCFPEFTGERIYMRRFFQTEGLPSDLKRWQSTVDAMLEGVRTQLPIFFMVDQRMVRAGQCHRRPGVHVDGYWHEELKAHGGGGHRPEPPQHRPFPVPGHQGHSLSGSAELLILASNVLGCRAYVGTADEEPQSGGDCSHFDLRRLERVPLEPGFAWRGETGTLLHESLPVAEDCQRTVVRLNVRIET